MTDQEAKAAALTRVKELVANFRRNELDYLNTTYNETQVRTDFISPFLQALGWDVSNTQGRPLGFREVIEEATVEMDEERFSKRPDYELRLARQRKLFVEVKKPSVRIKHDRSSAFQIRRYGYSAGLPICVLTSFYQIAVYDCLYAPAETDEAHVARLWLLTYDQFFDHFDEIWKTMSRDAVYSGEFDRNFPVVATKRGTERFDVFFLHQIRTWRKRLAADIHANNPTITASALTHAVQLFLCRIVFLRICEDRSIEKYETLRNLNASDTFNALMGELKRADAFYDSGIFRLLDDAPLGIQISDGILQDIISELYYPQSPYTFSVVETEVLGQIYEHLLGDVINVSNGVVEIINKPEIRDSTGVVPTPQYIADSIVERTLIPPINGKTPSDLNDFTVADICCGSGIFLLSAYNVLLEHYLSSYLAGDRAAHIGQTIYETKDGQWRLTFQEKRRILLSHIRGVDIDANAVEVTCFNLLLKLIENETAESLQDYVVKHKEPALPTLEKIILSGNSLVSHNEWAAVPENTPIELDLRINPFTWATEFPDEMSRGGFDVIVGNPPYVRIQNMANFSPEEVRFFQNPASCYLTAHQDNFDKYALFIERAFSLLRPSGRLGFIVPHKFMNVQYGKTLRRLITHERTLESIVHFGTAQVFGPSATNYTCILVFDKRGRGRVKLELPGILEKWRYGQQGAIIELSADELDETPWQFVDEEIRTIFRRVRKSLPNRLSEVAEIFVGVQTSADPIYIFKSVTMNDETITLRWSGIDWPIERGILRPCLLDVTLRAYTCPEANAWIIFPYELIPDRAGLRAQLIQPDELSVRFPLCWKYLNARRANLEQRNIIGGRVTERQWYQFGRSQSLTKFDGSKIILPVLSQNAIYSYDDTNAMVTGGGNGPYYMIRPRSDALVSNYYLLAVLNHPFTEAMIKTNTSVFRGGYYSHGKQFIENLPIPLPSDSELRCIEKLVEEIIDILNATHVPFTPAERVSRERYANELCNQIETHISVLLGVNAKEMEMIQAMPSLF